MTEQDLADWERVETVARIWWCVDHECNCTKPIIEKIKPNLKAGYPWVHREIIWEGTFFSDAEYEEWQMQLKELKNAIEEFKPDIIAQEFDQ